MRPLPLLLLLLASSALAQDPAAPPAGAPAPAAEPPVAAPLPVQETEPAPAPPAASLAVPAPPPPPPAEAPYPRLGVRLGLGLPDGVTADVVFRPLPFLRVLAGPAWNYLAFGLQGGVAVTPVRWAVSPVLEVRYGHFFGSDLSKVFKSVPSEIQPLTRDVGYDYFNGQLGLEVGSPRGTSFSLGVGLSYLWSDLHGTVTVERNAGTPSAATVTIAYPKLDALIPSVRLGMLFYF